MEPLQQIALLKGEAARRNLKQFIKTFWHIVEPACPFQDGYHVDAICDHLTHLKEIRNLLINVPPRMGKSTLVCVLFFAWYWATHPSARFIFSSYSLQLSIRDSIKARRLVESDLFQAYYGHTFRLTSDQNTKGKFENDKTGYRLATSVDGTGTGEGGDIIALDDAQNIQEAESKAARDNVVRYFSTVWANRLNDPKTGCRLLVMQRCHHEDLTGWLLKNDTEGAWTRLILPNEAGRSKFVSTRWIDARQPGELLAPDRLPQPEVDFLKRQLGRRAYEAQYNQNPAPPEDALFNTDNLRRYEVLPEGGYRIAAVDLAISTKGDYTVIIVADVFPTGDIYLVHMHRERMLGTKIVPTIKAIHRTFTPQIIYVEDVAFQRLVIQECRAQRLPVRGVKPEGDKVSRSVMLQIAVETGKVFVPEGMGYQAWVNDFEDEMAEFPNSQYDDQIDSASYVAIQANLLYRSIPKREVEETKSERLVRIDEERKKRWQLDNEDMARRRKEDEERMRVAFFEGL